MEPQVSSKMKKVLLVINCIILAVGTCGTPLLMRLYFIKGGNRIWLSTWLQTVAWPINFIPLAISYFYRRKININNDINNNNNMKVILMTPRIFVATIGIGVLQGFANYFYAYGTAKLPVSTSGLLFATQLAFTAGFAFLIVKLKFTSYSVNAVFLLTVGAVLLALHSGGDQPEGEPKKEYILGFIMTLAAAALSGLIFPLVELIYKKAHQAITYTLVLEFQTVYCFVATIVATIGMIINKDFQAISTEAKAFELGEGRYYNLIIWSAIILQFYFLGTIGVIYSASSLVSGILISVLLPITEVLAVFIYGEKFSAEKGVSLALSLWGFLSYFYGDIKESKKKEEQSPETEMIDSKACTP
ncbi:purine permease 3-like [Nicotiana tabacum]|uniref:Probable purine permease n=1 Tax=Nicotiana sylvestris TaxID=4096 RepID=A0A1U7VK80_NICSY|nr:PREDICTED: purine permease 3-like [Nicotiana sylvestris]